MREWSKAERDFLMENHGKYGMASTKIIAKELGRTLWSVQSAAKRMGLTAGGWATEVRQEHIKRATNAASRKFRQQTMSRVSDANGGRAFWDVVNDYASDGCTMTYTARALGIDHRTFRRMLDDAPTPITWGVSRRATGKKVKIKQIIARVEGEYNECFWDVVCMFAADGYARAYTAYALDISEPLFVEIIKDCPYPLRWKEKGDGNAR